MKIRMFNVRLFIFPIIMIFPIFKFSLSQQTDDIGNYTFISDFESGSIQDKDNPHDGWLEQHVFAEYSLNIVEQGEMGCKSTRNGKYCARFECHYEDNPLSGDFNPRVQLVQKANQMKHGVGYWIGLSVFIPDQLDQWNPGYGTHITQIFTEDDRPNGYEPWGPLHKLTIQTTGTWELKANYASDLNAIARQDAKTHIITGGWGEKFQHELIKGKWTDFVYFVRFSLGDDGVATVWKDHELIANYSGPFGAPDGPYKLILDIYGGVRKNEALVNYFDEIKIIEEGKGGYYDVTTDTKEEEEKRKRKEVITQNFLTIVLPMLSGLFCLIFFLVVVICVSVLICKRVKKKGNFKAIEVISTEDVGCTSEITETTKSEM